MTRARILITGGDPAGIGPDIILQAARTDDGADITVIADAEMLTARAALLGMQVDIAPASEPRAGALSVIHQPCITVPIAGKLDPANAAYVIACIDRAVELCRAKKFDAMVTAPVNKAVINDAGIAFSGHTEWLSARCNAPTPVMMLANDALRVCLLTTHLPLAEVPRRVTADRLREVITVIAHDLRAWFNISEPSIAVCGLNPHAGEDGYLGREEIEIIAPTLDALRGEGFNLTGPLPADTAFLPAKKFDAVLAMYHDQGLPVVKRADFFGTVNITLGLPIIRTSVDHGTAAPLAGSGAADASSLNAAIACAQWLARHRNAGGAGNAVA